MTLVPTTLINLPSSIRITELVSGLLFDTGCVIMLLKSSSSINGGFHLDRGVVRDVLTGDEYKLKFVGLMTPDMVELE